MPTTRVYLPLDRLRTGEALRAVGVDDEYVSMLSELEERLPPILVNRRSMRIIDGVHRFYAARLKGAESIEVEFFEGSDLASFVKSVELNAQNGLPLTLQDRKRCAGRIILGYPEWSDRLIAVKVGLSTKTVAAVRQGADVEGGQSGFRVGLDGRARPLNVAEGRLRAGEVLQRNPEASLREIAREAGISVGTARDVRERVRQGRSVLPGDQDRPSGQAAPEELRRVRGEEVNLVGVLDSLRRDPTLRYSTEGQMLIRWLDARIVRIEEAGYAARVPPHQAATIAKAARACASLWEDIALGLERRAAALNT